MASTDRRKIAPLLLKHFPEMEKASSDEWHGVLNEITGLNIGLKEPNSTAFDQWRRALGGYDVWNVSPEREQAIKARAQEILAVIEDRKAKNEQALIDARKDAPRVSAERLLENAK